MAGRLEPFLEIPVRNHWHLLLSRNQDYWGQDKLILGTILLPYQRPLCVSLCDRVLQPRKEECLLASSRLRRLLHAENSMWKFPRTGKLWRPVVLLNPPELINSEHQEPAGCVQSHCTHSYQPWFALTWIMHKQVVLAACKWKTLQDYTYTPDEAKSSSKDFVTYPGARGPRVGTDLSVWLMTTPTEESWLLDQWMYGVNSYLLLVTGLVAKSLLFFGRCIFPNLIYYHGKGNLFIESNIQLFYQLFLNKTNSPITRTAAATDLISQITCSKKYLRNECTLCKISLPRLSWRCRKWDSNSSWQKHG